MTRRKRKIIFKVIGIILFAIVVLAAIGFNHALTPDHEKKMAQLSASNPSAQSHMSTGQLGDIHMVISGNPAKPKVLLVHGSPGSWDNWMYFLKDPELLDHFCFISVDRPGYGKTQIPYQTDLIDQAKAILPILEQYEDQFILVGHSYGGAVIQQLALDYPGKVASLIYVAGTLEPEGQKPRWYNKVANTKIVSALLSDVWNASSKEMIGLRTGLLENEPKLKNMPIPTYFIMGKKDVLVPFSAVDYYKSVSNPNAVTYIIDETENHFIPWTKPGLIKDVLLGMKE